MINEQHNFKFTSNLKRAGAAIEDSLELLRNWNNDVPSLDLRKRLVLENVLGKKSFRRRKDFLDFIFYPRYVNSYPKGHWKYLQQFDKADIPSEILKQFLYFYTSINEPFIPFFMNNYIMPRFSDGILEVTYDGTKDFIRNSIKHGLINVKWTDNVLNGVASGLLNALAGFGVLQGKVKRSIAPSLVQLPVFYYVAFFISQEGFTGEKLIKHDYWNLFLLNDVEKKHLFFEAHSQKYLWFEEIGNIYRIEFKEKTFEEVTDVIIKRTT
jgi:hypothetical protein